MVAAAIAGAAVIGGVASTVSGGKAAKATEQAAQESAAVQRYMYDTTRQDFAPARQVGQGALYKLADMYGVSRPKSGAPALPDLSGASAAIPYSFNASTGQFEQSSSVAPAGGMTPGFDGFQASPGYNFRKQQAVDAIKAGASSRGLLGSTATAKNIGERVDGLASAEYDTFANRLAALAGVGQSATSSTAAAGSTAANGISNSITAGGAARASAYANTGSAINNGAQNLASLYLYQQNGGFGGGNGGFTPYGSPGNY